MDRVNFLRRTIRVDRQLVTVANETPRLAPVKTKSSVRTICATTPPSVLIDQGASVKAVQRHLGHASATTTLDTYAHLWPDAADVTRRALEAGLVNVTTLNAARSGVGVTGVTPTGS